MAKEEKNLVTISPFEEISFECVLLTRKKGKKRITYSAIQKSYIHKDTHKGDLHQIELMIWVFGMSKPHFKYLLQ